MTEQSALINKLLHHSVTSSSVALSKLLKKDVELMATESYFAPLWEIADYFEPYDEIYTAVAMKLSESIKGVALMVLKEESAIKLAQTLTGALDNSSQNSLNELKISALKETANIIFGALLTKISEVSNVQLISSIPALTTDMLKASLDELCGEIAMESSHALAFSTSLDILPLDIEGKIILIIDDDSMMKILERVK